jgi:hypothetical protein
MPTCWPEVPSHAHLIVIWVVSAFHICLFVGVVGEKVGTGVGRDLGSVRHVKRRWKLRPTYSPPRAITANNATITQLRLEPKVKGDIR